MRKRLFRTALILVPAGLLAGLGAWCVLEGYRLSRERVALERIWYRMENAYSHRNALVPDLIETAGGERLLDGEALGQCSASLRNAAGMEATLSLLEDPDSFVSFRNAQDRLSESVDRLLVLVGERDGGRLRVLRDQLLATQDRLLADQEAFFEAVVRYNESLDRFPGSLIGSLCDWNPVLQGYSIVWEEVRADGAAGSEDGNL